jgi:Rv0078B-related antitoxin
MTIEQRLKRALDFMEQTRQFKIASVRVHHPGWSEEKVMNEVRRWVRDGMKPEELYEL